MPISVLVGLRKLMQDASFKFVLGAFLVPTKAVAVGVQGPSDWQLVLDQLVVVLGDDANQVEHLQCGV